MEVTIGLQAVIVALTSIICQFLRRKPITELLTSGKFGLEASLPGFLCLVATLVLLYIWKPRKEREENTFRF
jgi:hypothetical protein